MKIRRALISVWDKTGIVDFARALHDEFGVEIISTGGTAKTLTEAGIPVTLVETLTGCGEMLDGRVKTLHPAIHAAILADRGNPEHMRQLEAAGIKPIDLVVVNLYPFEKTVADPNCTFEQAIEMIDIGGVALLRAAAKNERHVLTIWTPDEYGPAIAMFRQPAAGLPLPGHCLAGFGAFFITSGYDASIAEWQAKAANTWPHPHFLALKDWGGVRYGENSHQMARLLANRAAPELELIHATCGEGIDEQERMSFNNFVDADAALGLCAELTRAGNRLMRQGSALEVSPAPSTPSKTETGARSEVWNRPMAGFPSAQPEDPAHSKNAPAPKNSTPPKPGFASARKPITDERFSRRNLPHIQRPGASYFITFRTAPEQGSFTPAERDIVMDCCLFPDGELFCLHAAVCMPDHVHLLLTPLETSPGQWRSLTDVMHSIKGNIGRLVAEHRKRPGAVFQDESFDHIVRNEQDLLETIDYIRTNPLRAGLESSSPYPWVVLETAPGWDASTRAAGIDLKHELWAPRIGERAWYSRIDRVVRKTPAVRSGSKTRSVAGGAEENRPLAGSTLSGEGVSGTPGETRSADAREDAQAPQPPRADAPEQECVERPCACVFIKHTNACGVGVDGDAMEAYRRAYLGDPNAAMGGILACNFPVDAAFAAMVMETYDRLGRPLKEAGAAFAPGGFFVEVWIAPAFSDDAVRIIRGRYDPAEPTASADEPIIQNPPKKKWGENVRLLAVGDMRAAPDPKELQYRSIAGGMLVQSPDILGLNEEQWKVATKRAPTDAEMADLRLAWLVCKHTKSNAISICRDGMLLGSGAGQMSRVMSCRIATWLARENGHSEKLPGSVAASDAFFPFPDGPKILIDAGVSALIQPGGSKRDQETIDLCDQRGVAMIFTGTRHFKH